MKGGERDSHALNRIGELNGSCVFLSASIPDPQRSEAFRQLDDAQREIEQAVIALARAVFAHGGRLVFGGHPTISPLVALVAGEYIDHKFETTIEGGVLENSSEPPVVIHQLDVYRPEIPDATMRLEQFGFARVIWHETLLAEKNSERIVGSSPYPASLRRMRGSMLRGDSDRSRPPIGMVCIGGMEGVFEEASIFYELDLGPIFVLGRTGGASELLAHPRTQDNVTAPLVRPIVIDDLMLNETTLRLRGLDGEMFDAPPRFTPYPAIVDEIVRRLAG